jgi:hypothetical protein
VDSFADQRAKVDAARDEYVRGLDEQSEVLQRRTDDPDGTQHMHRVNQNVRETLERYIIAQRNMTDHVMKRM